MRKISVVAICLLLVLSLAACKMPQMQLPDHDLGNIGKPNTSVPVGSQAEESSQPDTQEAPASFLETVAGIWIAEDSVSHLYDNEYTFSFCSISQEAFGGGVYPGGADRPAKITECKSAGENMYELSLLYEAGEYMGDVLPEEHATLTVTVLEEGKISLRLDQNESHIYQYAGSDLDQAQQAVRQMVEP